MKMKFLLMLLLSVLVPATLALFSDEINDVMHKHEADCSKESGLDFSKIELIREYKSVPNNEKSTQWAKCMMQKFNVIKSDGTINDDVNTITIPTDSDTVIKAFPICKTRTAIGTAHTARLMMNCYLNNSGGVLLAFTKRQGF